MDPVLLYGGIGLLVAFICALYHLEGAFFRLLFAAACIIAFLGAYRIWGYLSAKTKLENRYSNPDVCRKILNGKAYDSSEKKNCLPLVESRAIPNQRLVRGFGIDNGFTTTNKIYREQFRTNAEGMLQNINWKEVAELAEKLAAEEVKILHGRGEGHLEHIVQVMTLKTAFHVFFNTDTNKLAHETVLLIAKEINETWIRSKTSDLSDDPIVKQLRLRLTQVLGEWSDRRNNPLNILLPVYETLWRIVVRCFVEINFRPSSRHQWRYAFLTFLAQPEKPQFEKRVAESDCVSVKFLVDEALRLYPPTRRIYREYKTSPESESRAVAADVEACHRLQEIWGEDSQQYRPARWTPQERKTMNHAFLPFGGGSYECPAKSVFGPRMIAILVAALVKHVPAEKWRLRLQGTGSRSHTDFKEETKLDSDRSEKEILVLTKK